MDEEEFSGLLASLSSGFGSGTSGGARSQPDSPSPSSGQQLSDRLLVMSSSSSGSVSPGSGVGGVGQGDQHCSSNSNRPRRHLPSPALAQAKSLLKLSRGSHAGHSFDVGDLAALHLQAMTSSPSAPIVSIASSSTTVAANCGGAGGRKLPVPGRHHLTTSTGHYNHHQQQHLHHHHSGSHLSLASAADALNEMDALIHHRSGPSPSSLMSSAAGAGALSGSNSSINSNSSNSRKLPVPPMVSTGGGVSGGGGGGGISQSRRLLPRPLSCDVPCYSDISSDFVLGGGGSFLSGSSANNNKNSSSGTSSSSSQQPNRNKNNHLFLSRPLSFDVCPPPDAELEEAATLLTPFHIDSTGSGSDPNLMRSSLGRGLMRQSSTTSCPSLMRPCRSPRSPNYHRSSNTTPSPLPPLSAASSLSSSQQFLQQFSQQQQQLQSALHQPLVATDVAFVGVSSINLVPSFLTPHPLIAPTSTQPSCSSVASSSSSSSSSNTAAVTAAAAAAAAIGTLPRPQTHYWPPPLIEQQSRSQNPINEVGGTVLIPSVGSAFRPPSSQNQQYHHHQYHQQHRQASLPPASMSDYLATVESLGLSNSAAVGCGGGVSGHQQQQLAAVLRRQRFQGGANGSISGSIQEYPASFQRLDWQRPSRSRPPARHNIVVAASAMTRYAQHALCTLLRIIMAKRSEVRRGEELQ